MKPIQDDATVCLRDACLSFGSGTSDPEVILDHLDLTVPRGAIYGLLGANGCGKTSLLTCIVGIRKLKSGQITVLGGDPGTPDTGPRIGYMPQETALMSDLSTTNILFYFGRIFGMTSDVITERIKYLSSLLDLPASDIRIKELSGGQQRRVSLAVALLHDPELLILDEPTVGLDSLLRQRIWDYLRELIEVDKKSVIITTHYIEEARGANIIGMMRQGKLLAENSPSLIMEQFNCDTLENVFLKLSHAQSQKDVQPVKSQRADNTISPAADAFKMQSSQKAFTKKIQGKKTKLAPASYCGKMYSLLMKNSLQYLKNKTFFVSLMFFPIFELSLFFLAIGHKPTQLQLAIVNDENQCHLAGMPDLVPSCNMSLLSCKFLKTLNSDTIKQKYLCDKGAALAMVKSGLAWGVMQFQSNFSTAICERSLQGFLSSDVTVEDSEIYVWLDMTVFEIGSVLKKTLVESYLKFSKNLVRECGLKKFKDMRLPMQFEEPMFGSRDYNITEFLLPGAILLVLYFLGVSVACPSIRLDMSLGIWNRDLVAGVTRTQMLMSHLIIQSSIMVFLAAQSYAIAFFVFGVVNHGSMLLLYLIFLLGGFCGIFFGIFISIISNTMTTAVFLGLSTFFITLLLTGTIWPLEGMPPLLRVLCQQIPLTSGIICIRSILSKGWGVTHPVVYESIARAVVWICAFLVASLIVIRNK